MARTEEVADGILAGDELGVLGPRGAGAGKDVGATGLEHRDESHSAIAGTLGTDEF